MDTSKPRSGPLVGGTPLALTGSLLSTATKVLFGTVPALPFAVTDRDLTVVAPPALAPGTIQVNVVTAGGTADGLTYTYVRPPTISSLTAVSGPLVGGNVLTVNGANLAATSKVTLAGTYALYSAVSDTAVAVIVPPGAQAGATTLTVTTPGGTASKPYTYL